MQIIGAILIFLVFAALISAFRAAIGAILGLAIVAFTTYLLLRPSKKDDESSGPNSTTGTVETKGKQQGDKVWIAIVGYAIGGLLLSHAFNPPEPLQMVPYGEIVQLIPQDLRGRYEACQLPGVRPAHLRCETVESEWRIAFEVAQGRAMKGSR